MNRRVPNKVFVVIGAIFVILALLPFFYGFFSHRTSDRTGKSIAAYFGVDRYFKVGSIKNCGFHDQVSKFELTGISYCIRYTAVAVYPRVETSEATRTDGAAMVSYLTGEPGVEVVVNRIPFPSSESGPSLSDLMGIPTKVPDGLEFTGIRYHHDKSDTLATNRVDGQWEWILFEPWPLTKAGLAQPSLGFRVSLDKKVRSGAPLADGAPTASDALRDGRAPLLVIIADRYCHSFIKVPVIDHACILPN